MKNFEFRDGDRIVDAGCGYGRLLDLMSDFHFKAFSLDYQGYDLSEEMISQAKSSHPDQADRFHRVGGLRDLPAADYIVASGLFNLKMDIETGEWEDHYFESLDIINDKAKKGFAFNVLSLVSDPEYRRADLYYADPWRMAEYCQKKYSRRVVLDHGYPLYEFTCTVLRQIP